MKSRSKTTPLIAIVAILLVGYAVLISGLLDTSLWADEGWTIAASAEANPLDTLTEWVAVDVHPPLFFINLNLWRRFTGDSLFELRYFSVVLSMLGIAMMYRVGWMLFGVRAGLLAALFYGLHDLVTVLTHEVRHYPQQMTFSILAVWMYARLWQKPTGGRGMAFAVAGAALLYTHYWGGLLLAGLGIHALMMTWRHNRRWWGMLFPFIGIGLLFLPWLPALYNQITLERPGGLPHALENSRQVYSVLIYQLVGIPELFWVILAAVGAMGAFSTRRYSPSHQSVIPLLWAVLPPALSITINTVYPTLSFRSLAVVVPGVILLAAHGLAQFRAREQVVMVLFAVLYALSTTSAGPIDRPDWPVITDYAAAHSTADDVILLENDTDEFSTAYYLDQHPVPVDYAHSEAVRIHEPESYTAFLDETLANHQGVWVLKLGWPPLSDIRPELAARGFIESAPERDYGIYNDRPILLWRLDRIPQGEPITRFGDLLTLHRGDFRASADAVTVNMLWSAQAVPERDYTVSVFLRGTADSGGTFRNVDSRPLEGESSTLTWTPEGFYFDSKIIPTTDLPAGDYQVGVQVYSFTDESFTEIENLPAQPCDDDPECRFVILGMVNISPE